VKRQLRGASIAAIDEAVARDPAGTGWLHEETRGAAAAILSRSEPA